MDSVESIYKNIGEEGRSTEPFVDKLNDKVHLMRIDVSNIDNARIVRDFRIGTTPFVSVMENQAPVLEEVVDHQTYERLRDHYEDQQARERQALTQSVVQPMQQADQSTYTRSDVFPDADYTHFPQMTASDYEANRQSIEANKQSIEAAEKAQKAAEDAQKAAEQALNHLNEARRALEKQNMLDKLKREAEEARKQAEEASKELEKARDEIAKHLAEEKKAEEDKAKQEQENKQQNGSQDQITTPDGYTIEYVPVLKPIDQDTSSKPIINQPYNQQSTVTTQTSYSILPTLMSSSIPKTRYRTTRIA